jgi:protein TonB
MSAPAPTRNPPDHMSSSKGIWIFAATLALSLHLAFAAFAIVRMQDDPNEDDLGAPGIEIGLDLTSPQTPPSDLPPGPDSDAAVAAPPVVEQKTVDERELPKETPVESENPDRLVTTNDVKTPKEEEPDVTAKITTPSEESVAQEATAAPSIDNAPEAPKSVTRDQGTAASRQRVRVTWQRALLAHLNKYKRYPGDRSQKKADIVVKLQLDRTGRVVSASVDTSSGDSTFDAAALAMIHRANPVPAPPPVVADDGLTFMLPVNFRVAGQR